MSFAAKCPTKPHKYNIQHKTTYVQQQQQQHKYNKNFNIHTTLDLVADIDIDEVTKNKIYSL